MWESVIPLRKDREERIATGALRPRNDRLQEIRWGGAM